jgi:choice-of-anchor C domain-containing protein
MQRTGKCALVLVLACMAVSAQASTIIFSDGFNFVTPPPSYITVAGGGTIGPWSVGGNSVDWIGGYWQPAEDNGSIDMSGGGPGSLSTTLSTVAGQSYTLSFYIAGNPDGGNVIKSLQVAVGSLNQVFTFDTTGHSEASMGWVLASASFVAAGSDTLTFTSLDNNAYGAALDAVSVSSVPEPGTLMMLGSGILGLAGMWRRKINL